MEKKLYIYNGLNFNGNYSVSSTGNIISHHGKDTLSLKPSFDNKGYKKVWLYDGGGNSISVYVHQLVFDMFSDEKRFLVNKQMDIHHIDENKENNNIENLTAIDRDEHIRLNAENIHIRNGNFIVMYKGFSYGTLKTYDEAIERQTLLNRAIKNNTLKEFKESLNLKRKSPNKIQKGAHATYHQRDARFRIRINIPNEGIKTLISVKTEYAKDEIIEFVNEFIKDNDTKILISDKTILLKLKSQYDEIQHAHHIDKNKTNNNFNNIIFISPTQHTWIHRKENDYLKSLSKEEILEILKENFIL